MINNVYQKYIKTQTSTKIYDGDKIKNEFLVEYLNNSIIDFNNKNSSLMKSIEDNLNKEVKDNILLKNIIFSKATPSERPYRINYVVLNSDTFYVGDIIKNEIKNYNKKIENERKRNNIQVSRRSERSENEISTSYHTCSYCRNGFSGKGYYLYYGRDEYGNFGEHFGLSDTHNELCCSKECALKIMQ
jgi:hypothetical protein